MGAAGNALIKDIEVQDLIETLDGYYCYYQRALHWSQAVLNRLEGQALFVLPEELEEVAEQCFKSAKEIAERIGELGGSVTGDPTQFVARSRTGEFRLPAGRSGKDRRYRLRDFTVLSPDESGPGFATKLTRKQ